MIDRIKKIFASKTELKKFSNFPRVVLYSRTSTKSQNIKTQTTALLKASNKNNYQIIKTFKDEGVSGFISDRKGFKDMMSFIENNQVDKIFITEVSRFSRDVNELRNTIIKLTENKTSIHLLDLDVETLKDGKLNYNNLNVLLDEIKYSNFEISKMRKRLNRGYREFLSSGGKVGRKVGYRTSEAELLVKHDDIVELLTKGYTVRITMAITKKSSGTVQKIRKILKKQGAFSNVKTINSSELINQICENEDVVNVIKLYSK
jgi:DNA invertase Pin-like site-specific DNA recombinase